MISSDVREYIFDRDGRQCRRCQERRHLCIDHVLPKSYMHLCGAPESAIDATWNLQTLCIPCNKEKGVTIPPRHYIDRIRELDDKHQRSVQMSVDRDINELREHPEVAYVHSIWEHLLSRRRRLHDNPSVLELPQYFEVVVLNLFNAGATRDDWQVAVDAAVNPSIEVSAWDYFVAVVNNRIDSRGDDGQEPLFPLHGWGA